MYVYTGYIGTLGHHFLITHEYLPLTESTTTSAPSVTRRAAVTSEEKST